jgi:hypothetical protein
MTSARHRPNAFAHATGPNPESGLSLFWECRLLACNCRQPAGNILAVVIVVLSDSGLGKLPRPTGWQPVLLGIKESKAARESVKSDSSASFDVTLTI